MDRGIIDKNGETGDVNNYDYMNTEEMCYSMCKLFLSGCLFLEPKYSDTSASSGTPMGKSYSHLIFQTEGTDVPGRAGFARRTQCSEIWTASSGDLHGVKHVTNSSAFETLVHTCTKKTALTVAHPQ